MIVRCCIPFVLLLVVGAQPPTKDDGKKDRDKLQGEWAVVSWESKTQSLDKEQVKKSKLVVNGDEWQLTVDGKEAAKLAVKLDPSKNAKEIDLTLGKDFTMKGIYKLEGHSLTLCRTPKPEVDRPKEFKAADSFVLIVFKRVEKK